MHLNFITLWIITIISIIITLTNLRAFGSGSRRWLGRHVRGTLLAVADCKVLAVRVGVIFTDCTAATTTMQLTLLPNITKQMLTYTKESLQVFKSISLCLWLSVVSSRFMTNFLSIPASMLLFMHNAESFNCSQVNYFSLYHVTTLFFPCQE